MSNETQSTILGILKFWLTPFEIPNTSDKNMILSSHLKFIMANSNCSKSKIIKALTLFKSKTHNLLRVLLVLLPIRSLLTSNIFLSLSSTWSIEVITLPNTKVNTILCSYQTTLMPFIGDKISEFKRFIPWGHLPRVYLHRLQKPKVEMP